MEGGMDVPLEAFPSSRRQCLMEKQTVRIGLNVILLPPLFGETAHKWGTVRTASPRGTHLSNSHNYISLLYLHAVLLNHPGFPYKSIRPSSHRGKQRNEKPPQTEC